MVTARKDPHLPCLVSTYEGTPFWFGGKLKEHVFAILSALVQVVWIGGLALKCRGGQTQLQGFKSKSKPPTQKPADFAGPNPNTTRPTTFRALLGPSLDAEAEVRVAESHELRVGQVGGLHDAPEDLVAKPRERRHSVGCSGNCNW